MTRLDIEKELRNISSGPLCSRGDIEEFFGRDRKHAERSNQYVRDLMPVIQGKYYVKEVSEQIYERMAQEA